VACRTGTDPTLLLACRGVQCGGYSSLSTGRGQFRRQPALFLGVWASTYVRFSLGTPLVTQAAVGVTAPRMVKGKTPLGDATLCGTMPDRSPVSVPIPLNS